MKDTQTILEELTLEEKIELCEGADFWQTRAMQEHDLPAVFMCDGPLGLRKQEGVTDMLGVNVSRKATCFPAEVTTASSWNPAITEAVGKAMGQEANDQGVDLVLGPGANIKRNPLCGRNFEYFSEDPYLSGKMAAGFIRGMESQNVGACLKHFAANSQEKSRFTSDSVMDERTLHEMYLPAFEIAVREGKPSAVMSAYPKLNGIHCSDHRWLLNDLLRKEWGFDGFVVTDWGGMNDRIKGFRAGCDLMMPGGSGYMAKNVAEAVRNGTLSEADLDASVRRIIDFALRSHSSDKEISCDYEAHDEIALKAAEEGCVLLKNENDVLPLAEGDKIAIIGRMAKDMRYQGAGSSHTNAYFLHPPIDSLQNFTYAEGYEEDGSTGDQLIEEAVKAVASADEAVIFAGLPACYESEGFDRENMRMPDGHLRLIEAVAKANPHTIVVLFCGSPVECDWADRVQGILFAGLPGQAGGRAVSNLLYGRVNPSGKLAETWPLRYEDCASSETYDRTVDALYKEGIYVGYRYYDNAEKEVRWPFGYGLSYTSFALSDLQRDGLQVRFTVTNTGMKTGSEVVQLYLGMPQNGIHRPLRELRHFRKTELKPGESQEITFTLEQRDFAIWDGDWVVPEGDYTIHAGTSSADLPLSTVMHMEGEDVPLPVYQKDSFYETCKGKPSLRDLENAMGHAYHPATAVKGSFTMENTVMEMKDHSLMMKIMYKAIEKTIAKGFDGKADYSNPEFRMMMEASAGGPMRSMAISGGIRPGLFEGMIEIANGHLLRGIGRMIRGK